MDIDAAEDLFPEKLGRQSQTALNGLPETNDQQPLTLQDRISAIENLNFRGASKATLELFPEKVGGAKENASGKSLAERIQENPGLGTGDLFPDLLREGGGGRRRRRKAEDHF
jgi:hypothetical protein